MGTGRQAAGLEQRSKLFGSQLSPSQDRAERTRLDWCRTMQDDRGPPREIVFMPHEDVRAPLTEHDEAGFLKGANEAVARNLGEVAHAATSTSRSMTSEAGIGWRSASNPSR